jgi:hypothetical protein
VSMAPSPAAYAFSAMPILAGLLGAVLGCSHDVSDSNLTVDTPAVVDDTLRVTSFNWRYFVSGTEPRTFLGSGGPEDLLYHGERAPNGTRIGGDQEAIIDWLATNGGDGLYVEAVKSHGGDGIAANGSYPACPKQTTCYSKANPFLNGNPKYAADPGILDQWYTWLRTADDAGIVSHVFLYDDSACPWFGTATDGRIPDRAACLGQTALIPEEDSRLITPMVTRLKSLKNIVWVVAEEYSEAITTPRAQAIAARIRALDPVHAIAVHELSGTSFHFAEDPNVRVFDMQLDASVNSVSLLHNSVVQAYDSAAGRYAVVVAEAAWHKELVAAGDRTSLRQSNWAAMMGGAAGVLVYGFWEPTVPSTETAADLRRIKMFFESTNWSGMSNSDAAVSGATRYARANPSGDFVMYSDSCIPGAVLGYSNTGREGDYKLEWFDAIDGSTSSGVQHLSVGSNRFTAPAHLSGECGVWVHHTEKLSG